MWWKDRSLFSIFEIQSCLYDLNKWHSIARSTRSLIPDRSHKIISSDICKIVWFRNHTIWNVFWCFIILCPALCLLQNLLKFRCIFTENFRATGFYFWLGFKQTSLTRLTKFFFVTICSIFWMSSLEHACISFPSKIVVINIRNSFISGIRRDMCLVEVYSVWIDSWSI